MARGEIRTLAAFADGDRAHLALDLAHRFQKVALAQAQADIGHTILFDDRLRILQDGVALGLGQLGALLIQRRKLLQKCRSGTKAQRP